MLSSLTAWLAERALARVVRMSTVGATG